MMKFTSLLFLPFLVMPLFIQANTTIPDEIKNGSFKAVKLITQVTEKGQKISGIALQYEADILSGKELAGLYQVEVQLDNKVLGHRHIVDAYTQQGITQQNDVAIGDTVFLVLDKEDKFADSYELEQANTEPMNFRAIDAQGTPITKQVVQSNKVPKFYGNRLQYVIKQKGLLKLTNSKTVGERHITVSASSENVVNPIIDRFQSKQVSLNTKENYLNYRVYIPDLEKNRKYPLVIFLHGSGQVGSDNIAHLLSSRGAISVLDYSPSFIVAPQYQTVFDPFDDVTKGQQGGIHWQTNNRRQLVLKMIDKTILENPQIDTNRVYLIGLSRGAEGAMSLLLDRPTFFAGALLMSGREAGTVEWIDGKATTDLLAPIKDIPIWFFHSKEDKVSPVAGTRKNYTLLHDQLRGKDIRYTEFSYQKAGDNGIVNNNPHNTWDAVFNSPAIMRWLLAQQKRN
ncbi:alpha/beta hydrolase-fold protein [Gallibacterium trehalosifermentans]|uniref:Alpha/beta hydrolase-fold protein n=1 Tax=Gallibacterium trehalosifermentans TaxID=516935 RepID=A0ABV6H2Z5_9PAST